MVRLRAFMTGECIIHERSKIFTMGKEWRKGRKLNVIYWISLPYFKLLICLLRLYRILIFMLAVSQYHVMNLAHNELGIRVCRPLSSFFESGESAELWAQAYNKVVLTFAPAVPRKTDFYNERQNDKNPLWRRKCVVILNNGVIVRRVSPIWLLKYPLLEVLVYIAWFH